MSFGLQTIRPEQEPFDLGDGRIIYFKNKQNFDFQEVAAWERITRGLQGIVKMREQAKNEDQFAKAQKRNDQLCTEMVTLVLPDLPNDILAGLTSGQIDHLASMCIQVVNGALRGRMPGPDELAQVRELYPELPEEFLSLLLRGQVQVLLKQEATAEAENPTKRGRVKVS